MHVQLTYLTRMTPSQKLKLKVSFHRCNGPLVYITGQTLPVKLTDDFNGFILTELRETVSRGVKKQISHKH